MDHYEGGINTWGDSVIAFGKDYNGTTEIYNATQENWSILIDDSIIKGKCLSLKLQDLESKVRNNETNRIYSGILE